MERRDYSYYEKHAADINLEEITSSAKNANTLQRLRNGDDDDERRKFYLGRRWFTLDFYIGDEDDLGWLGYFIGKNECVHHLYIDYLPDGQEGHALMEGIARSQSIREIDLHALNDDGFTSTMRILGSLSQLEGLIILGDISIGSDGLSELETLLESGVCKLQLLSLWGINFEGIVDILSNGLRSVGSSLKELRLRNNSIGNEGLLDLVEALQTCTGLEILNLCSNDFSSAAAGLRSISDWLQRDEVKLNRLGISRCHINDEGLLALAQGAANHCKELDLHGNNSITTLGLSHLSNSIQSDSCRVETLHLDHVPMGVDGMEVLAYGLADNKSVRHLFLGDETDHITVASARCGAFSTALCDTSSVSSTYLSNHTLQEIRDGEFLLRDISLYLRLNEEHPQYAARCKILLSHRHLDMDPLLQWGLKFLPMAVAWFERSKPCTALTIYGCTASIIYDEDLESERLVLEESEEVFESRQLTALYEFVRGMPMKVMKRRKELIAAVHGNEEIARIDERYREALEQRDRKIEQLEEEMRRLKGL